MFRKSIYAVLTFCSAFRKAFLKGALGVNGLNTDEFRLKPVRKPIIETQTGTVSTFGRTVTCSFTEAVTQMRRPHEETYSQSL